VTAAPRARRSFNAGCWEPVGAPVDGSIDSNRPDLQRLPRSRTPAANTRPGAARAIRSPCRRAVRPPWVPATLRGGHPGSRPPFVRVRRSHPLGRGNSAATWVCSSVRRVTG